MTFKEMLSRCEEQKESVHNSIKIEFETWDATMKCAADHMDPTWIMTMNLQEQVEKIKKMKNK